MVKTIAENFSAMLKSAADLLKAADGAGMPARAPTALEIRNAAPVEEDEADEPEGSELVEIVKQVMPLVHLAVTSLLTRNKPAPANGHAVPAVPRNGTGAAVVATGEEDTETATAPAKDMIAHMQAIEALLTEEELLLARRAVLAMAPGLAQAWGQRLCELSAEEAAKVVKAEIEKVKGGAS